MDHFFKVFIEFFYNIASVLCFGFLAMKRVGSSSLTQGSNPGPLPWELGVLATELPGKSPVWLAVITMGWFYRRALVRKYFRGCSGSERRVLDFFILFN